MRPDDKPVYMIVGATGGIGKELCARLETRGAHLVLLARDKGKLQRLAGDTHSHRALADAADPEEITQIAKDTVSECGHLDGIVNCVGSLLLKPAHLTTLEEWNETIQVNLGSAFAVVRAAAHTMRRSGGSVVLIASAAGRVGIPNHEAIAAAKAGIIGLGRSAAATYASYGIRFNMVAPGLVETSLTEKILSSPSAREQSESMHPLGRIGKPADIASMIAWLIDPEQSWITGQVFGVDGGLAALRSKS